MLAGFGCQPNSLLRLCKALLFHHFFYKYFLKYLFEKYFLVCIFLTYFFIRMIAGFGCNPISSEIDAKHQLDVRFKESSDLSNALHNSPCITNLEQFNKYEIAKLERTGRERTQFRKYPSTTSQVEKKSCECKCWIDTSKDFFNQIFIVSKRVFKKISNGVFSSSENKIFLTLSPGSSVMLVPMPLVMRGVPAQIFFAVPENQNNWVKTNSDEKSESEKKFNSRSTILCRSNLSLISLQAWTMWTR